MRELVVGEKLNNYPAAAIMLIVIAALGFLVYSNSMAGKFVYDDEYLVRDNAYIKSIERLPRVFTEDIGSGADRAYSFYRPVLAITYAIDYAIWGLKEFGYHLSSVAWHILAALCVFWLVFIVFGSGLTAFLTALLFVAHPIHVEAVSYISGRSDPIGLVFSLLTFIFYIKALDKDRWLYLPLSVAAYALALLSREHSLILPVLILLYHALFRVRMRVLSFLSIFALGIGYIVVRLTVLKPILTKIVYDTTLLDRLPGSFAAISNYARILFLPFELRMEYGYAKVGFADWQVIAGGVILATIIAGIVLSWRGSKLAAFGLSWYLIALLPILNLYPINAYMAEHWLYMPSVGIFLLLGGGVAYLWRKGLDLRLLSLAVFLAFLAFVSVLTYKQNDYWRDPVYFYERTLKYVPNNMGFHINLGRVYAWMGRQEDALRSYKRAIELEPRFAFSYNNIGNIYLDMGKYDEAIVYYKKAMELDAGHPFTYNNLGNLYLKINKPREALDFYKKASSLAPNNAYIYNNVGKAAFDAGEPDQAIEYCKKALDIDPSIMFAYTNIAQAYAAKGDNAEAIRSLERALKVDPSYSAAYGAMIAIYYNAKDIPKVLETYDRAKSRGIKFPPEFIAQIERLKN